MLKSALRWSILARKPTHSTVPAKVAAAFSTTPFRILCRFRQQSYRSHSSSTRTVTLTQAQTSSGVWRFLLASSAVGLALHAESKSESEADASVLDEKQRKRVNGSSPSIACSPIESLGANYTRPVVGIVALNALVFGMWRVVPAQKMLEHFSFNLGRMLTNGRYYVSKQSTVASSSCSTNGLLFDLQLHTPVTSMFSHESLLHFGFNMYALANIAPPVVRVMGEKDFLWAYFGKSLSCPIALTCCPCNLCSCLTLSTYQPLASWQTLVGQLLLYLNMAFPG